MEVRKVTAENKQSYFRTCYAHNCKWQRRTHWLGVQVGKGNSPPPGCSAVRQRYLSVWAHSNTVTGKPLRKGHALHLKEQNHSMISHFQSVKVSLSMAWRPCMTWPFTSLTSFPTSAALADSLSALFWYSSYAYNPCTSRTLVLSSPSDWNALPYLPVCLKA